MSIPVLASVASTAICYRKDDVHFCINVIKKCRKNRGILQLFSGREKSLLERQKKQESLSIFWWNNMFEHHLQGQGTRALQLPWGMVSCRHTQKLCCIWAGLSRTWLCSSARSVKSGWVILCSLSFRAPFIQSWLKPVHEGHQHDCKGQSLDKEKEYYTTDVL